ncbi:MAG: histidine phosphatase family protein [Thermodesulfobacteriota bacterium]
MARRLFMLRHGEVGYPGRYVGASDLPLNVQGREQIRTLGPVLAKMEIDLILASPMKRCRMSCEELGLDRQPRLVEELREIDFGRWELKSFEEIAASDPELVQQWAVWSADFCFPQGESVTNFLDRVQSVAALVAEQSAENILLVTHGGMIRSLLCHFLGLPPEDYLVFQVDRAKYCTLELHGERGVLSGFNLGQDMSSKPV